MSKIYNREYFLEALEVPEEFLDELTTPPRLLPGERVEDYYTLLEAMIGETLPISIGSGCR